MIIEGATNNQDDNEDELGEYVKGNNGQWRQGGREVLTGELGKVQCATLGMCYYSILQ